MRAPSARSFSSSVCSSAASDCSCSGSQRDSIARTRRTVASELGREPLVRRALDCRVQRRVERARDGRRWRT